MQETQSQHRRRTSSLRDTGISRPDQDESMMQLASVASALLKQACEVLEQIIAMPNGSDILTHESTLIVGSSIGKHLRHSLDHYKLLLDSVPLQGPSSQPLDVNYDTRVRLIDMESKPDAALLCFQETDRRLSEAIKNTSLDQPLKLTALTPHKQEFGSTFGRELWFVALHAIHHYSLLRVIACGELGMTLPPKFGVAPSTLAFRKFKHEVDGPVSAERLEKGAEQVASAGKVKL